MQFACFCVGLLLLNIMLMRFIYTAIYSCGFFFFITMYCALLWYTTVYLVLQLQMDIGLFQPGLLQIMLSCPLFLDVSGCTFIFRERHLKTRLNIYSCSTTFLTLLIVVILVGLWWYLIMVLMCVFWFINEAEHFFMFTGHLTILFCEASVPNVFLCFYWVVFLYRLAGVYILLI